ncbi:MAG: hypothetical protein ACYTXA_06680 [Nostoc sp.]
MSIPQEKSVVHQFRTVIECCYPMGEPGKGFSNYVMTVIAILKMIATDGNLKRLSNGCFTIQNLKSKMVLADSDSSSLLDVSHS